MHTKIEIDETILDDFIELLQQHESDIVYDYNGKSNQILIKSSLVTLVLSFIQKHLPQTSFSETDLTKAYIRAAFELQSNSVVISKNGNIFIKIIDESVKKQIAPEDQNTVKNRYNGIDEDELYSFYKEFFEDQENQNFFFTIAKEFVERYFHTKQISHEEYEQKVFAYIHNITLQKLTDMYDDEDGFFLGFAGYVFRIHFKEVFNHIAELILEGFAQADQYMIDFLNYYAQDILVINGEKYKVPHIEAENGLRWNVPSMLSIVKIYTRSKQNIKQLNQERALLEEEVQKYYANGLSPVKNNELQMKKQRALEIAIQESSKKIKRLQESLENITKDERKKIIQADIFKQQDALKELRKEREVVIKRIIKKETLNKYITLQKDLDTIKRKLQREHKILQQNEEAYSSIKNALVKALISKKSKI